MSWTGELLCNMDFQCGSPISESSWISCNTLGSPFTASNLIQIQPLIQSPGSTSSSTTLGPKTTLNRWWSKITRLVFPISCSSPCSLATSRGSYRWKPWVSSPALSQHSECKKEDPDPEKVNVFRRWSKYLDITENFYHLEPKKGWTGTTCDKFE